MLISRRAERAVLRHAAGAGPMDAIAYRLINLDRAVFRRRSLKVLPGRRATWERRMLAARRDTRRRSAHRRPSSRRRAIHWRPCHRRHLRCHRLPPLPEPPEPPHAPAPPDPPEPTPFPAAPAPPTHRQTRSAFTRGATESRRSATTAARRWLGFDHSAHWLSASRRSTAFHIAQALRFDCDGRRYPTSRRTGSELSFRWPPR